VVQVLAEHFHWPELGYVPKEIPFLQSDLSFEVTSGGAAIGVIGCVADRVTKRFEIKQSVFLAEMKVSSFIGIGKPRVEFSPLPVYPAALRDLALIVEDTVKVGDIVARVREIAGKLLERVTVFDLYTGKQIEKGKKSIGVSITYRSRERSLSSEEVDRIQANVMETLSREYGAVVRDK
jgi:phenylalanyl-tRNA synthetase beta chain